MGFNAKLFEVVLYSDSYDFACLEYELKHRSGVRDYAYVVHDKCKGNNGSLLKSHAHVMMRMNNSCNSDNVAKWFCASPSQVEKCKGRWADMLAYLTHDNAPDKFQYAPECVVSNFDWLKESKKAGKNGNARLNELLEGVMLGEIRRFNIHEHMTVQEFAAFKPRLTSGFEYRAKKMKGASRDMESIYVYGDSGTGKTTWAKDHAKQRGMSVYISSGSNDILDDYEGQDCIILDDLRPSCLGLSDLLKMLDPRTASTVKSRYYNKVLECKMIIITTTLQMSNFFHQVFENESEPLKQLERRCGTVLYMTKEHMSFAIYQPADCEYVHLPPLPNVILMSLNIRNYTDDEMLEREAMLMGSTVEAIKIMRAAEASKEADDVQRALDLFKNSSKNDKAIA